VSGAEGDIAAPSAAEQIEGLTFALLLLDKASVIRQVNQAGEDLIGVGARRLVGQELCQVVSIGDRLIADRLAEPEAQLTARGVPVRFGERDSRANITVSSLASHPGWRVMTFSDAGPSERLGDENRASPLRGPAILAHEIKNPLSAIRGAAQLLARKAGEGEKPMTDLIANEVDRIAELIDRMQRLGREQPEPVAPLNLHQAIRRACETVFTPADKDMILREEFDPSLPPVLANEGALVQVLVNLIANARDAARESEGHIRITASPIVLDGAADPITITTRRENSLAIVDVSDDGPGMGRETRRRIFDPFFTTKDPDEGTGMGLTVVQGIMRSHDGAIHVTSVPDQGSTFALYFPRFHRSMETPAPAAEPVPGGTEWVLFVDDEEPIARLGCMMLERLGYKVVVSTSGDEALALFRADPERFDLVITDHTMPGMTGAALAQALRHLRPGLPVILCSGFSHTINGDKAAALGLDAFLLKPFLHRDLGLAVRRVLEKRHPSRSDAQ